MNADDSIWNAFIAVPVRRRKVGKAQSETVGTIVIVIVTYVVIAIRLFRSSLSREPIFLT